MDLSQIDLREYDIKDVELRAQREMREWAERDGNWALHAGMADEKAREIAQDFEYGSAATLALFALANPALLWEDASALGEPQAGLILSAVIAERARAAAFGQFEATRHEFELRNEEANEGFADETVDGRACDIEGCDEPAKLVCFADKCGIALCAKHACARDIYSYCPAHEPAN